MRSESVAEENLKHTCQHHRKTIHKDDGEAVEGISQAYKLSLRMFIQLNHVETICRNVVGSTTEGDEEEEAHRCLEP